MSKVFSIVKSMAILAVSIAIVMWKGQSLAQTNPPKHVPAYPAAWWAVVDRSVAASWEILPQEARYGEVILSKRLPDLGLLSNFAGTPFFFHGKRYASVEGFWQAMKFPEKEIEGRKDPRAQFPGVSWPHARSEVESMVSFEAKNAGNIGSKNMQLMNIDWVSFEGRRLLYHEPDGGEFYQLIVEAMRAKLEQNPGVKRVLLETGDLTLKPDHNDPEAPKYKAWRYFEIWMMLRSEIALK